mgnify:CR=1 FL=1
MSMWKQLSTILVFSSMLLFCLFGTSCHPPPTHPRFPQRPGVTLLTPDLGAHGAPTWSPDSQRIAFSSAPVPWGAEEPEIYVMDAQGGNRMRLTNDSYHDTTPAWSPKGDRIAFVSNRDGTYAIYTMTPDGSDVVRLVEGQSPAWSPDGEKIAFWTGQQEGEEIFVWEKGQVTRLTRNAYPDSNPSWSPDGQQIVFVSQRIDTNKNAKFDYDDAAQLYVMNADGTEQRPLLDRPDESYLGPAWSPTGRWIVFNRYNRDRKKITVEMLDLSTGEMRLLLDHGRCGGFAWSPDGKRLAFTVSGDASDIYVMDVAVVLGTPVP